MGSVLERVSDAMSDAVDDVGVALAARPVASVDGAEVPARGVAVLGLALGHGDHVLR